MSKVLVNITSWIPKFVDLNLEVQGPFEPNDIAFLQEEIVHVLLKKNKCELLARFVEVKHE